jgi:hypothetical protein
MYGLQSIGWKDVWEMGITASLIKPIRDKNMYSIKITKETAIRILSHIEVPVELARDWGKEFKEIIEL